jgi:glycosyltransferase involved in cell wall biosynthesis
MNGRRLKFCYIVPGHDLLASIGPSRNVVNLARAMKPWADVTVAFHRIADPHPPQDLRVLSIEPVQAQHGVDDAAMKNVGYGEFLRSLRQLRRFVDTELREFDVVLEKSWLLSGYVSRLCNQRGQLAVPIENIVPSPKHAASGSLAKQLRVRAGRWLAGRCLRSAPLVIAETEFLKREIERYWHVAAGRIAVVDLGVDKQHFRPRPVAEARAALGWKPEATVLLYVGVLDKTHNLEPAIRALREANLPGVELHVVGDGFRAAEYRQLAEGSRTPIVFHGRVPHDQVPQHIAAADLCLAPYDASAFSSGELGYSTMKIPEYLSMGRPVASVSAGRTRMLIQDGTSGFLFDNDVATWQQFLGRLPGRQRLAEMGAAAAAVPLPGWEDTAQRYYTLCSELLARRAAA